MTKRITYPSIDMQLTGRRLKHLIETAGYTPRMIQEYLHLSCVQPIYRWYKGLILPSVDHLLLLSELLDVHMEGLLVKKKSFLFVYDIEKYDRKATQRRILFYCKKMQQSIA